MEVVFPVIYLFFFKKRNAKYHDVCAHLQSVQWREYSCGKQCSDVLHIDESSWNTAPVFKTVGNWACIAFIAFCGNMMYLFWEVRQFIGDLFSFFHGEYYSNEADGDNRILQQLQVIFLQVALG